MGIFAFERRAKDLLGSTVRADRSWIRDRENVAEM